MGDFSASLEMTGRERSRLSATHCPLTVGKKMDLGVRICDLLCHRLRGKGGTGGTKGGWLRRQTSDGPFGHLVGAFYDVQVPSFLRTGIPW